MKCLFWRTKWKGTETPAPADGPTAYEETPMTFALRQPARADASAPTGRAAEAIIDQQVDYSDEVTAEQVARIERAYSHIDKSKLKSKSRPAW